MPRDTRPRRPLLAVAVGVAGTALLAAAAHPAIAARAGETRPPQVTGSRAVPAGSVVLDPQGRVLVLHGLNMVYKLDPYAPDEIGFGRDDARFLARNGFTTVRLGLIWKAVEPQPGQYDDAYLARIERTTRILADEGIWTLLDFHQDLFHEDFQGEGAPDWAVLTDGAPNQPQAGFPNNYFANSALNRAFDNFWANTAGPGGVGLQDRYAAAWAHVATAFRDTPGVLGIDVFNEPWPGTGWQSCANPEGCPVFDAELQALTQKVIDAVRAVDAATAIFYEPHVLFNNGAASHVAPEGDRLGFSFHDYCLTADVGVGESGTGTEACTRFDDLVWGNAADHVAATGHPGLLTEFGATQDQDVIRDMMRRADEAMTGWQFWAYCGCDDPTTTGPGATQALVLDPAEPPRGDNVDRAKLRSLAVPHPLAVAGTPLGWHVDRAGRTFTASWTPQRVDVDGTTSDDLWRSGSRTTLSMPAVFFPHGYTVEATGLRLVSEPDAPVLVVARRPGATAMSVRVTAR